jgi:mitochondrial fission protein ELM1
MNVVCWVVSDGKIGIDNQCIGLAEAVGVSPIVKHVSMRSPWRHMFPIISHLHAHAFRPGDALAPPWPDLLITGGRSGAAVSLFVKKASGGRTVTVHIQNPHIDPKRFDLLAVGRHDKVTGKNVLVTRAEPRHAEEDRRRDRTIPPTNRIEGPTPCRADRRR